jgi:hypothetical protein
MASADDDKTLNDDENSDAQSSTAVRGGRGRGRGKGRGRGRGKRSSDRNVVSKLVRTFAIGRFVDRDSIERHVDTALGPVPVDDNYEEEDKLSKERLALVRRVESRVFVYVEKSFVQTLTAKFTETSQDIKSQVDQLWVSAFQASQGSWVGDDFSMLIRAPTMAVAKLQLLQWITTKLRHDYHVNGYGVVNALIQLRDKDDIVKPLDASQTVTVLAHSHHDM